MRREDRDGRSVDGGLKRNDYILLVKSQIKQTVDRIREVIDGVIIERKVVNRARKSRPALVRRAGKEKIEKEKDNDN